MSLDLDLLPINAETERHRPISPKRNRLGDAGRPPARARSFRKGWWVIGGLAVYSFTTYGAYLYLSLNRAIDDPTTLIVPEDVSDRYNRRARGFDNDVWLTEKLMGLGWLRRSLTKKAWGNVLEVSVGTGRNAQYYNLDNCKHITMVDQSPEMIEIARTKFKGKCHIL